MSETGDSPLAAMGADIDEARVSGKASYSRKDGLPLSFERKQEIALVIENEMMGGEMEMEMNTTSRLERKKGFAKPAPKKDAKPAGDAKKDGEKTGNGEAKKG